MRNRGRGANRKKPSAEVRRAPVRTEGKQGDSEGTEATERKRRVQQRKRHWVSVSCHQRKVETATVALLGRSKIMPWRGWASVGDGR
jgi:hypothetical protein